MRCASPTSKPADADIFHEIFNEITNLNLYWSAEQRLCAVCDRQVETNFIRISIERAALGADPWTVKRRSTNLCRQCSPLQVHLGKPRTLCLMRQ